MSTGTEEENTRTVACCFIRAMAIFFAASGSRFVYLDMDSERCFEIFSQIEGPSGCCWAGRGREGGEALLQLWAEGSLCLREE
jgi:hypothetical protein